MKTKTEDKKLGLRKSKVGRAGRIETAALSGAIAGAAAGSIAGPAGAAAGAIVGGAAGALTGNALADEAVVRHGHDAELDEEIGVMDGQMGAASPDQPPAKIGAYSSGSAGTARPTPPPAEGPIQDVDE